MAYTEGYRVYYNGKTREDCPYEYGQYGYNDWMKGYTDAAMDD